MALQKRASSSSAGQEAFLLQRPGLGRFGEPTYVYANHFRVRFEAKRLYHYDVSPVSLFFPSSVFGSVS